MAAHVCSNLTARAPGAALLHPLAVVSLVALVVNDHVLKHVVPGVVTGKLSDFAGVLLLPLFLQAAYEVARRGRAVSEQSSNRVLLAAIGATVAGFSLVELVPVFEAAYRVGLGALQWPFQLIASWASGDVAPPLRPVRATADWTDLLALPMVGVAFRIGRHG
jgi:hypothetical protein